MFEKIRKVMNHRIVVFLLPVIILLLLCLVFALGTGGRFISSRNLKIITDQALVMAIVATGGVFVYSSGNMNLALGGSTAIACIFGAMTYLNTESYAAMFFACVVTGLIIMALCVVLSQVLHISIIVVTMILMTMLTALQEWLIGSNPIKLPFSAMNALQKANVPLTLGIILFVVCILVFEFTPLGKTLKFFGDNETCAKQTGLNELLAISLAFAISGIGVGVGAFAFLARSATVASTSCNSLNMDVMLAIVLAGTPMDGGNKSKIFSGVVGALMTTVLSNGLLMMGVDSIYIQAVKGILFVIILITSSKRSDVLPVNDMVG